MGRRRLVALVSALLMLVIGGAVIGSFAMATQSDRGRDFIRRVVQAQLARSVKGTFHLGTLSGSFITDLTVDSIEIRDEGDSLFAAAGPIRVTFDPRDLMDGRLIIRSVEIARPRVAMRREMNGAWNTERIWPKPEIPRRLPGRASFASVLVLEQVKVTEGEYSATQPWAPADSLRGAARDSAITAVLNDGYSETRRAGPRRFTRTLRWRGINADIPRLRLAYPDSVGRFFDIARLDAAEANPPFKFRDVRGTVRWVGDSIWFDLPHFALTNSSGRANGKVWIQPGVMTHYRVHVEGDSVALADVAWIAPSLPTEGNGRMTLDISNARGVPNGLQYAITGMDVRSHKSRVRGKMTWVIGGPVAILKDVDLEALPIDFRLIERFNQGPFPYPFAGQITARMRGRGGPLNRFMIDDLRIFYRDGNIPGAVAQGRARGELDILVPANATFHRFTVELDSFDLRTPQAINPDFPALAGKMAGVVVLDSSWLDVRLSEADLTHRDGDLPESRFTGSGRLTSGEIEMAYDVAFEAQPISMTTLAKSFPGIPLRGEFSGPLKISGTLRDLLVVTDLSSEAGRIEADVRIDAEAPRYRLTGETRLTQFDPQVALNDLSMPSGELTARFVADIRGDSLADLEGSASVVVDRSTLSGVRIFAGDSRLRFADGKAYVDTLHLETTALELDASGALGLHAGRRDSVTVRARADSLGGVRRWVASDVTDTLAGALRLDGIATGWVRDFAFDATLDGAGLLSGASGARLLTGDVELTGLPSTPTGTLTIAADTMRVGGFAINRAFMRVTLDGTERSTLDFDLAAANGTRAEARARVARSADTLQVLLDSLMLRTGQERWSLGWPATFTSGPQGFFVDSFQIGGRDSSLFRIAGRVPRDGALDLAFRARGLPVADLAELLQVDGTQEGRIDLDGRLQGTRAVPTLDARASLRNGLISGVRLDTLDFTATAVADALRFTAALGPPARPIMRAEGTLPLALRLDGAGPGMLEDSPVSATVRADTVSLRLFESLTTRNSGDPGNFGLTLDLGGTWRDPRIDGGLVVRNGDLAIAPLGDVRWRNITADIGLIGDSLAIRRLSATSSVEGRDGRASISGWMTIDDLENPRFDLTARATAFHAYKVRNVADIDLSDSLRIDGTLNAATLRGGLTVDRAIISIPEIATKSVISLAEFDRFGVIDTTRLLDRRFAPPALPVVVRNLTVRNVPIRMGRDVWLRSAEANINLGGQVSITRAQDSRGRADREAQIALTGALQTVRGSYRLDLGPVQRTFEVERGEIRWFGDADFVFNPSLDIGALHTVRQYSKQGSQPDVRVRVNIGGTLLEPTAVLSTPDSSRVKSADLISYLVTGGPSFEIGGRSTNYTSTAARVLISSLGSVLGGKAGGLCDDARLSTSGIEEGGQGIRGSTAAVLEGTRFNCGKQVGDRAFVRLDAGLCQVGQLVQGGGSGTASALANSIGVKIDYLLQRGLTLSAGMEPPTSAVLCSQSINARGFVPTPQQFGFDLFRAWRF